MQYSFASCRRRRPAVGGEKGGICMEEKMNVNGKEYVIEKLLGKGKGGYSYLAWDVKGRWW